MREIKYKAFERGSDNVLYWCSDDGDDGFWELVGIFHQQYDLVEYTGLKDKNDVEIYEGDIVKSIRGEIDKIVFNEDYARYEVFNEDFSWAVADTFKVIGNVYENLELLKEGN